MSGFRGPTVGHAKAVALQGICGTVIDVEAFKGSGLPAFNLVGLPDASLNEAKHRIKAACASAGHCISGDLLTVNLSPASIPKAGTAFDVAIAMSVFVAKGLTRMRDVANVVFLGELGLDGVLRGVRGVLPAVTAALEAGFDHVVVPSANAAEAQLVSGMQVTAVDHFSDVLARFATDALHVEKLGYATDLRPEPAAPEPVPTDLVDFDQVAGQSQARFGLEVAAAGGHHALLVGAPGSGKTMLASRLPTILPPLADPAAREVTAVESITGNVGSVRELVRVPPFVSPHHSATPAAMIGGGSNQLRPGAISHAHHGVLFLDEAPEFGNHVLQALRQPLESGTIDITRSRHVTTFPARFQLILAANPCPCGYALDPSGKCECSSNVRRRYLTKISGPLLDRIDVRVVVTGVSLNDLAAVEPEESSAQILARVMQARAAQEQRWAQHRWSLNAHVPGSYLRGGGRLAPADRAILDTALDRGLLTARGYDRTLRLAWTVADLAGAQRPDADHVALAMSLRGQLLAAT